MTAPASATFTFTTLLRSNQQVPGLPAGTTLTSLRAPVLNESGHVAFVVGTNTYVGGFDGFRMHAVSQGISASQIPILNDVGDVAFLGETATIKVTASGNATTLTNQVIGGPVYTPGFLLMNNAGRLLSRGSRTTPFAGGAIALATPSGWDPLLQNGTALPGGSPLTAITGGAVQGPTLPSFRDDGDYSFVTFASTPASPGISYASAFKGNTESRTFQIVAQNTGDRTPLPSGQQATIPIALLAANSYPSTTLDGSGRATFIVSSTSQSGGIEFWRAGSPSDASLLYSPFHSATLGLPNGITGGQLSSNTLLGDLLSNSRGDVVVPVLVNTVASPIIAVRIRNGVARALFPSRPDGTLAASLLRVGSNLRLSMNENGQVAFLADDGLLYASDVFDSVQSVGSAMTSALNAQIMRPSGGRDGRARVMNSASQIAFGGNSAITIARVGGTARLSPTAPVLGPAVENGYGTAQAFAVDLIQPDVIPVVGDTGYVALDTRGIADDLRVYLDLTGTSSGIQLVRDEIASGASSFGLTISDADLDGYDLRLDFASAGLNDVHYFYWNIMNLPGVDLTRIAVVPEPQVVGFSGLAAMLLGGRSVRSDKRRRN